MKNIKEVHGRFNSFEALGAALGVKAPKGKAEKPRECPMCGGQLRHCNGSNVWLCDFFIMAEDSYVKDGETIDVYVLRKCLHREIDPV